MLLLIIVIIIGTISYFFTTNSMQEQAIEFSQEILKVKAEVINEYIYDIDQYVNNILSQRDIQEVLSKTYADMDSQLHQSSSVQSILAETDTVQLRTFMNNAVMKDEIQSVALYDYFGNMWLYENDESYETEIQTTITKEMLYKFIYSINVDGNKKYFYLYDEDGATKNIILLRKIYSPSTYNKIGYLGVICSIDYLEDTLANENINNTFKLQVFENNGQAVYVHDSGNIEAVENFMKQNIVWQVNADEGLLLVRTSVKGTGWFVVSTQELTDLLGNIIIYRRLILFSIIIVLAVCLLIAWRFASNVVAPITKITEAMQKVRTGNADVDVVVDRADEIGYMGKTFNTMISENRQLVQTVYQEQIIRKETELQALQSQINPHFLFNTLETISWEARLNKSPHISTMAEELSDLMRMSISKISQPIRLQTEIHYIDKYLAIMKKRFGDRLTVKKKICEELNNYLVPKLLIQPLIENAIYHGIESRREGGTILIKAWSIEDGVEIIICNSGAGLPQTVVNDINDDLKKSMDEFFAESSISKGKNIGLQNVNRRIMLYYGQEYGIKIDSKHGYYTKVIMSLPIQEVKEDV